MDTKLVAVFLVFIFVKTSHQVDVYDEQQAFCYTNPTCGPDSATWPQLCHIGTNQSPVNLNYRPWQRFYARHSKLRFSHSYSGNSFRVRNNGHSIAISFSDEGTANSFLEASDLDHAYQFDGLHFHWGPDVSTGSEHTLNGKHYALEMHMVHYNTKYANLTVASESEDPEAIVVLGFFMEAKEENADNEALAPFLLNLPVEYQPDYAVVNEPFHIHSIFPKHHDYFFEYFGSLTTPECSETVLWKIMLEPIPISMADAEGFYGIRDKHHKLMRENFRPLQSLNEREVDLKKLSGVSFSHGRGYNSMYSYFG